MQKIGIGWATSVWDVTSAKEMIQIPCDFLKVPSACNNHFPMLTFLRDEYEGDVHISTGMTTKAEIEEALPLHPTHSPTPPVLPRTPPLPPLLPPTLSAHAPSPPPPGRPLDAPTGVADGAPPSHALHTALHTPLPPRR